MTSWETVWTFNTARFAIALQVAPDDDLDLSWDDDGEVRAGLNSGNLVAFVARVVVLCDGAEVGADYLGGCIYKSAREFRDLHDGYFPSMVREAIGQARANLTRERPRLRTA